jgi:hypothetical protein
VLDTLLAVILFAAVPLLYHNVSYWCFYAIGGGMLLWLFIEPIFLTLFGTTPGKRIFGISVLSATGKKLTYGKALRRTHSVYRYGSRGIPDAYGSDDPEKNMPCRCDVSAGSVVLIKSQKLKWYQPAVYFLVWAALIFAMLLAAFVPRVPPNRGRLTVAQFAENYNYLAHYYKRESRSFKLGSEGIWVEAQNNSDVWWLSVTSGEFNIWLKKPIFSFETDADGYITQVRLKYSSEVSAYLYLPFIMPVFLAVVCAQDEYSLFHNPAPQIADSLSGNEEYTGCGTRITYLREGEMHAVTITITP